MLHLQQALQDFIVPTHLGEFLYLLPVPINQQRRRLAQLQAPMQEHRLSQLHPPLVERFITLLMEVPQHMLPVQLRAVPQFQLL